MNEITENIPRYSLFILIGIAIQALSAWLESDFVIGYLLEDLMTILIALLAINLTTIGVIITKLQELAEKGSLDHSKVIDAMRFSIKEQIFLIISSTLLLLLLKSKVILNTFPESETIIRVLLISILSSAVWILYTTGEGIFKIARKENQRMLEQHRENRHE